MRLLEALSNGDFCLTEKFLNDKIPPYAILSHTWGDASQEVTFEDMIGNSGRSKAGYKKIRFCGEQASRDGIKYFWVDSCCIKKSSDSELSESINSMFRWYQRADKCYAYLSDVSTTKRKRGTSDVQDTWQQAFRESRWFTRGWTLQELVAPASVQFFSIEGELLGDKKLLEKELHEITGIDVRVLQGDSLSNFTIPERMSWATNRQTARQEDKAYSLLGIFGVHMPLIYGEGEDNSFRRLREAIRTANNDQPWNASPLDNVPRREVAHFVPRVEQQKMLTNWLQSRTPSQMTVLQGMGGSGKTQLALQCCQIAKESDFVATFWINASSPATVAQSYRSISRIISPGIDVGNDEGETIFLVQNQIKKWTGKWLLVFDNYNDPNAFKRRAIRDYIPGQGGHVLFTSRNKDSSRLGHSIDLSRMTEDEGIKLLSHFIPDSKNSEAGEVVALLGYLALAIDQAGAYIHSRLLPLSQFVSHYKKRKMRVLEEIPDEWEYHDLQDPDGMRRLNVLTTWDMSLDLVKGSKEEKEQKLQFLTLASFMDPYQISEGYFRSYSSGNDVTWMEFLKTGDQWDTDKLADVLAEFSRLSLIQSFDRRENDSSFSIHPLICDCMKFRKTTDAMSTVIELTNMLATFLRTHDIDYLPLGSNQETTRHINAWSEVNENIVQNSSKSIFATHSEAIGLFANVYMTQGLYDEAEQLYRRVLDGEGEKLGPTHPETLRTVNNLALVYRKQGRYDEAEQLYRRAQEGQEKKLGPVHPDTLRTVDGLAIVYQQQGRYNEAEQLYGQVLKGRGEKLGLTHPDTLSTVHGLASVYRKQGRYDEAEQLYKRALKGREEKLGPTHPDTLRTVIALAIIYWQRSWYDKAEQLYSRALKEQEEKLGPKHSDTLRTVSGLALVYWNEGRYNEAEQLYSQALEGQEKKLGSMHHETLSIVNNLALVYQEQGRYKEAEQLYGRALEVQKKLGPTHPNTLTMVNNLALVYRQQGRYNEAEQLYGRALKGQEEKLGPTHPATLETANGLASLYQQQSRYEDAEQLYGRALKGREERFGPMHPDTLSTVNGLASVYQQQGQYNKAEQFYEQALKGREEKLGLVHPDTLRTVNGLASVYQQQGRHDEAERLYVRALEGRRAHLGATHPDTLKTIDGLASLYREQGRHDEAEQLGVS